VLCLRQNLNILNHYSVRSTSCLITQHLIQKPIRVLEVVKFCSVACLFQCSTADYGLSNLHCHHLASSRNYSSSASAAFSGAFPCSSMTRTSLPPTNAASFIGGSSFRRSQKGPPSGDAFACALPLSHLGTSLTDLLFCNHISGINQWEIKTYDPLARTG
jgi:hypothetical protein